MNLKDLLKNTMAIKENSEKMKAELANITAEGYSGGKMVSVTVNGTCEIKAIHLDPICVDNRDVKMLEDLIVAAHHDACKKVEEQVKSKATSLLGDLNIDGLNL